MSSAKKNIILVSVIRCPICKYKKEVPMPTDSCQILYECEECNATIKPKDNTCCVFCSYGTVPCPTYQKSTLQQ